MRKLLFCIITSVLFVSCKKSYTCDCSTTWIYKTTNNSFTTKIYPGDKTPYSEKLTKKQAKVACEHQRVAIETDVTNGVTENGKYSLLNGESVTTDCSIILK